MLVAGKGGSLCVLKNKVDVTDAEKRYIFVPADTRPEAVVVRLPKLNFALLGTTLETFFLRDRSKTRVIHLVKLLQNATRA